MHFVFPATGFATGTVSNSRGACNGGFWMIEAAGTQSSRADTSATVSVVITCYNHGHFLREAIDSVLAQSYGNFEIILVDDGSTDDTSKIAETYPGVRYVHQKNSGLAA